MHHWLLNDKWHLPITIDSVFSYIQVQRSGIAVNYRKDYLALVVQATLQMK